MSGEQDVPAGGPSAAPVQRAGLAGPPRPRVSPHKGTPSTGVSVHVAGQVTRVGRGCWPRTVLDAGDWSRVNKLKIRSDDSHRPWKGGKNKDKDWTELCGVRVTLQVMLWPRGPRAQTTATE